MMDALASVALLVLLWGAAEAYWALKRRLREEKREHSVGLFCPNREERVPIASEETEPVRYDEENGMACYECEECGGNHMWIWGPPAPIYVGDKIRLRFTPDGMVQAELDAD